MILERSCGHAGDYGALRLLTSPASQGKAAACRALLSKRRKGSPQRHIGPAGYDPVTYRPTNASAMGPSLIPAVVHQTWKNIDIPEQWQAARQSCIDLHPGFLFRLWTDEDARALIARDLPELLPTYDSYPFNIQRADAIRCMLNPTYQLYQLSQTTTERGESIKPWLGHDPPHFTYSVVLCDFLSTSFSHAAGKHCSGASYAWAQLRKATVQNKAPE